MADAHAHRSPGPIPPSTPGARRAAPGLEILRQVVAGELPSAPMASLMGYDLVAVADRAGRCSRALPAEFHYNPAGHVHGGFAATLLDSAMGVRRLHRRSTPGSTYTDASSSR